MGGYQADKVSKNQVQTFKSHVGQLKLTDENSDLSIKRSPFAAVICTTTIAHDSIEAHMLAVVPKMFGNGDTDKSGYWLQVREQTLSCIIVYRPKIEANTRAKG